MIKAKEIIHRDYADRACVGFTYRLEHEASDPDVTSRTVEFRFTKVSSRVDPYEKTWCVSFPIYVCNSVIYHTQAFGIPKSNLPLEKIAAAGLKVVQYYLQQMIQEQMDLDFAIGDVTEGM